MSCSRKELVLGVVKNLVANFLYYDRKEDWELPRGAIQEAIRSGVVTVDEIVETFRKEIEENL